MDPQRIIDLVSVSRFHRNLTIGIVANRTIENGPMKERNTVAKVIIYDPLTR